jgi:hypothetical protein
VPKGPAGLSQSRVVHLLKPVRDLSKGKIKKEKSKIKKMEIKD